MPSYFRTGWQNDPIMTEKPVGSALSPYVATCSSVSRVLLPAPASVTNTANLTAGQPTQIIAPAEPRSLTFQLSGREKSLPSRDIENVPPKKHRIVFAADVCSTDNPVFKKARTNSASGRRGSPSQKAVSSPRHSPESTATNAIRPLAPLAPRPIAIAPAPQNVQVSPTSSANDRSVPMGGTAKPTTTSLVPAACPSQLVPATIVPAPVTQVATPALEQTSAPITPTSLPKSATPDGRGQSIPGQKTVPHDQVTERARRVIRSQFDVEVMLKHKELERINQEMAKCQATLEQLRRCKLIPYSSTLGTASVAALSTPNQSQSAKPPSWGVVDGPYSAHYATWLIPDPMFEPEPSAYQAMRQVPRSTNFDGRASRLDTLTPPTRSTRASAAAKTTMGFGTVDAFASGTPARDPLVLRRSTDGKLVRLVCNKCQKDQFANVQGFINHYRIQHHYGFKSHDAAAIACGQPVDENGCNKPAGDQATQAPAVTVASPAPQVNSIITAPTLQQTSASRELNRPVDASGVHFLAKAEPVFSEISEDVRNQASNVKQNTAATPDQSWKASDSEVPHLSDLLRQKGFTGDLTKLVAESKVKVDLSEFSDHGEDSEAENEPVQQNGSSRHRSGIRNLKMSKTTAINHEREWIGPSSPNATDSNPGMMTDIEDDVEDEVPSPVRASKRTPRPEVGCQKTFECSSQDVDMVDLMFPPS